MPRVPRKKTKKTFYPCTWCACDIPEEQMIVCDNCHKEMICQDCASEQECLCPECTSDSDESCSRSSSHSSDDASDVSSSEEE